MLKSRQDLADYREAAKKAYAAQTQKIIICAGTGCVAGGSLKVYDRLKQLMLEQNLPVEISLEEEPHGDMI